MEAELFEPRVDSPPPALLAEEESADPPAGSYTVPADSTFAQILDAAAGGGYDFGFDFASGFSVNRSSAATYSAFNRCVTLIAGAIAHIMTQNHHLRIVDADSKTVKSRRANRVLETLMHSPDGGATSAVTFIEDVVVDYLTDGNALVYPNVSTDGMLQGFRRMSSYDSEMIYSDSGRKVYRTYPAEGRSQDQEYISARELMHIRWPHLLRYGRTRSTRRGFALSPVYAMRPAITIGMAADRWVQSYFGSNGAVKSQIAITYDEFLEPDQREQVLAAVAKYVNSRLPLVVPGGGKVNYMKETAQDAEAEKLRTFQVREVSRVYGVPPPLLGESITQWGQGLLQLTKLFYSQCVVHHLNRVLGAFKARLLQPGQYFTVDSTAFLGADEEGLARLIMAIGGDAQRVPVATREEMRRMIGLPRDHMGEFREKENAVDDGVDPMRRDD